MNFMNHRGDIHPAQTLKRKANNCTSPSKHITKYIILMTSLHMRVVHRDGSGNKGPVVTLVLTPGVSESGFMMDLV